MADPEPWRELSTRVAQRLPDVELRPIDADDMGFLRELYASTREAEFAAIPWPSETKQLFFNQQFDFQHRHFRTEYAQADFLLVRERGVNIGRVYLDYGKTTVRVVDIALMPEHRGRGVGTALLESILCAARTSGHSVDLHVEQSNRARHLYARLGFELIETRGFYDYLRRSP